MRLWSDSLCGQNDRRLHVERHGMRLAETIGDLGPTFAQEP